MARKKVWFIGIIRHIRHEHTSSDGTVTPQSPPGSPEYGVITVEMDGDQPLTAGFVMVRLPGLRELATHIRTCREVGKWTRADEEVTFVPPRPMLATGWSNSFTMEALDAFSIGTLKRLSGL